MNVNTAAMKPPPSLATSSLSYIAAPIIAVVMGVVLVVVIIVLVAFVFVRLRRRETYSATVRLTKTPERGKYLSPHTFF